MDPTPILSLCHFCEIHGPSVVFSTQSFIRSSSHDITRQFVDKKDLKICEGCSLTPRSLTKKNIPLYKGYVTNDETLKRKYITTNEPICYKSLIKQACVRSLSCETYPQEKEGAIYFGDDIRWHNLSWLFVLKDSRARGFNRTYSIVISHPTKAHLLSSWKFYSNHVDSIIDKLKLKSAKIFKEEIAMLDCKQQRWSIRLDRVSQFGYPSNMNSNLMNRVARYNNPVNITSSVCTGSNSNQTSSLSNIEDSSDDRSLSDMDSTHGTPVNSKDPSCLTSATTTSSSGISSISGSKATSNRSAFSQASTSSTIKLPMGRDSTNTQRVNSEARSLIDLTRDELIFANIHLLFCHILKSTTERLIQLSPLYHVERLSSSIDSQSKHLIERSNDSGRKLPQNHDGNSNVHYEIGSNCSNIISSSSQIIQLDKSNLNDHLTWRDAKYFTSLRHMYIFLGRDKFKIIGYHTIVGSNILIICKYRDFLFEFMRCLAKLLPTERMQEMTDQETSIDCWKLNILGVVGNKLPNNILESNYQLLIDISDRNALPSITQESNTNLRLLRSDWQQPLQSTFTQTSARSPKKLESNSETVRVLSSNYRITLHSKEKAPIRLPQFLTNLIEIIRNVFYSDDCLEKYLIATKEDWLTNAKMVWAIARNNLSSLEDSDINRIYHLFNIEDYDRKLIHYWADADMTFKMNAIKLG